MRHVTLVSLVMWASYPRAARAHLALLIVLLAGCATVPSPTQSRYPNETERAQIGRIAVVASQTAPRISVEPVVSGKGSGAAKGAGTALGFVPEGCLRMGVFAPFCIVVFAPFAAAGGAAYGAVVAPSKDEIAPAKHSIEAALAELEMQGRLRDQTLRAAQAVWPQPVIAPQHSTQSWEKGAYRELAREGVETVLEVAVIRLEREMTTKEEIDSPFIIILEAHARLISVSDGREIYQGTHIFRSKARHFRQWAENDAEPLREAFELGYQNLAANIVENALFLYPLPQVKPFGLHPVYPQTPGFLSFNRGIVDSLQPTLRWEAFPRAADLAVPGSPLARARNIRYELRIARVPQNFYETRVFEPVYSRDDLPLPQHTLEQPLWPGSRYSWSVRARFDLDGLTRITPWSGQEPYTESITPIPLQSSHFFFTPGSRLR